MTDFQALVFYAANVSNEKIYWATRDRMSAEYKVIKNYQSMLKSTTWKGDREALKNSWLPNATRNFISACEMAQSELVKLKPVEVEEIPEEIFERKKKKEELTVYLRKKGYTEEQIKIQTGEVKKKTVPVSEPYSHVKPEAVVTSTIPPSVAEVDAGYLPAVDTADVQSATDVSGAPVEQVSDVFLTNGVEPGIDITVIPSELTSSTTIAIVIVAIVYFFILPR